MINKIQRIELCNSYQEFTNEFMCINIKRCCTFVNVLVLLHLAVYITPPALYWLLGNAEDFVFANVDVTDVVIKI